MATKSAHDNPLQSPDLEKVNLSDENGHNKTRLDRFEDPDEELSEEERAKIVRNTSQ